MKKQLIQEAQDKIRELNAKIHAARGRLTAKRKELNNSILDDSPDLFGNRRSSSPGKLFDERVDPASIAKALEPIKEEIADYNRQLDKWTKDLLRLANMPETDLFTETKIAV